MKQPSGETSFAELDGLNHVPLDATLDALAHTQRRKLLFALLDHDSRSDSPVTLANSDDGALEHPVKMNLVHLPKLADHGFIDWNRATHEVARGPNFDEIEPLLELLGDHEDELPEDWL